MQQTIKLSFLALIKFISDKQEKLLQDVQRDHEFLETKMKQERAKLRDQDGNIKHLLADVTRCIILPEKQAGLRQYHCRLPLVLLLLQLANNNSVV